MASSTPLAHLCVTFVSPPFYPRESAKQYGYAVTTYPIQQRWRRTFLPGRKLVLIHRPVGRLANSSALSYNITLLIVPVNRTVRCDKVLHKAVFGLDTFVPGPNWCSVSISVGRPENTSALIHSCTTYRQCIIPPTRNRVMSVCHKA